MMNVNVPLRADTPLTGKGSRTPHRRLLPLPPHLPMAPILLFGESLQVITVLQLHTFMIPISIVSAIVIVIVDVIVSHVIAHVNILLNI